MSARRPEGLAADVVRINFERATLYARVLLLLHLVLLVVDVVRLANGTLAEHAGYRLLFYAHIAVAAVLAGFVTVARSRPIAGAAGPDRLHDVAWRLLVVALLVLAGGVSIIDQLIHGQITVYIIGALGISIGAYMPLRFALPLYGLAHAAFITALLFVQRDPDHLVADVINGTLVIALAVFISRTLYTQFRRGQNHLAVIERQRQVLERLATEDSLTGLPNRRSILRRVEEEFERGRRYGPVFSLAIADLDHFKDVNDTYTHTTGDEVLTRVAKLFRSALRTPDVVARYGGEEFLFLFPESTLPEAEQACEKIRAALLEHPWEDIAPGLRVTTSIGVAYSADAETAAELIAAADRNLYAAKRGGRNCVRAG